MLDTLFGLNARLGRLQYFLACIALGVTMVGICFALVVSGSIHVPRGSHLTWQMLSWPAMASVALFVLATVTLQAMRVRDIGWDPVIVIAAWFSILFVDAIIAAKMPGLALGREHFGTIVGSIVNLVMTGILLFWPGNEA
jgi:uncharacterized membrane protein YhaH (DUF805 family)